MKHVWMILLMTSTLLAQSSNWSHETLTDPMSDKVFQMYSLAGSLVTEDTPAHITMACNGGKLVASTFDATGLVFHPDFYASLRLASVTYAKVRLNSKVIAKGFLLSQDNVQMRLSKSEIESFLKADKIVFQFSDAYGTQHYASFTTAGIPESFGKDCRI